MNQRNKDKKKVLFIVPSLMRGGMENMLVVVANIIVKYAEVTIYNLGSHDEAMVRKLNPKIHYWELWSPCNNLYHSKISDILEGNFRLFPSSIWYCIHSGRYIHKKVVKEHFDVEIAFFVGEPMKIVSGCQNTNTNKIMWIHSDYSKCEGLYKCFCGKRRVIKALRGYRHIVCVSENAKSAFDNITQTNFSKVVYNYLPVQEILQLSTEPMDFQYEKFTIVGVGRLVNAKGFDRLLRAAIKLNANGFEYQIIIIGDGNDKDILEKIKWEYKLDNVHLVGMKQNPYPYIANADLLVCTSRYEGYNLTVAEAIILGVPVMSTKCTGPTEILENGKYGYLVENEEEAIYEGLKLLISDRKILQKLRQAAVVRKDFFDEKKIKKQLLKLILD